MKKTAFAALWVKDVAEAVAPHVRHIGIVAGAIALMCVNTALFGALASIALMVAGLYVVVRLIAFVGGRTIRGLGFTEPGLERMALA